MWVPLHLHSQFSILDAACSVEAIAKRAAELNMPAIALTDHGNMFGAVDFYKACQANSVKPIIGCELYVAPGSRHEKKKVPNQRVAHHLVLLAKDQEGYHNLCQLSSLGYLEGFYYHPRVDKELLEKHSRGLICLSACLSGRVADMALHDDPSQLEGEIAWYQNLFGEDYYLELQRHIMTEEKVALLDETWLVQLYREIHEKQQQVNQKLIDAGGRMGVKCVATNDTHYMEPEDWQAHEILLNIQSGEPLEIWDSSGQSRIPNPKRRVYASREFYFKTPEEMATLFSDIPEAISNTLEVAEKCEFSFDFKSKHYPIYIPPTLEKKKFTKKEQKAASKTYLRTLCEENIDSRYTPEALEKIGETYPGKDPIQVVRERLEYEFAIVAKQGMCDYLLIVWDFINWSKKNRIPVGPGRGSGAGSIILYLIGVTDIEPLRFHLYFERFINPERLSDPDIDVDICMSRRNEVIDYTLNKYGKEKVAQIITFGTMKAKMTIKDVGRVLSIPLSKVNAIAKLVPDELNITLTKALEMDADLHKMYINDEDARRIIDFGKKLEGSIRNTGIHAAGIIICEDPLVDHIPTCLAKDSEIVATQFSMKPVEAVGMLKIDFLGLKTLTSIQLAVDAIQKNHGVTINWTNLNLEDSKTFELLQQGKTLGVFQMESGGMQELGRQLQPDKFEEIIAIGALYRPGPMDKIPSFVNRKHGREPIEYDHPALEPILSETYGIAIYQEQVMEIARKLANYSLGEGDVLRWAMGKKVHAQMVKERKKFLKGAMKNGLSEQLATTIFDKMEKFASYGFNKSHATAYGYLTYVTAYLKANYPKEWMAALMTCDRDDISKVAKFIRECQALEIPILPPDVNESSKEFVATPEGIRFAMTGIKGVGEGIVEVILQERKKEKPFTSFYDFFKRIDVKRVGKKAIECLADAGCFDFTGWSRDALRMSVEPIHECAAKDQKEAAAGVLTLFSLMGDDNEKRFAKPPEVKHPTPKSEILKKEKELLGFYLTGHPMDDYKNLIHRLSCTPLCQLEELGHNSAIRVAFVVESVQVKISAKTQRKFAFLRISDEMESYELPIWSDLYEEKNHLLDENQLLFAVVQVDKREEIMRLSCRFIDDLTKVDEGMIEASDRAYDRAKLASSSRFSQSKPKPKAPDQPTKTLALQADARQIHLSDILMLKDLIRSHPGPSPVFLEFYADNKRLGILRLGQGISPSKSLETALAALQAFKMVQK